MSIDEGGDAAVAAAAAAAAAAAGDKGGEKAWYAGIENAELRGFAENKAWKDPGAAIESYRQLEKSIGVPPERLLRLPDKADAPEWAGIREKLGFAAPANAEAYGIVAPEGADPGFAKFMGETLLKHSVPTEMAKQLAADYIKYGTDAMAADQLALQQQSDAEIAALRTEWGGQFDASSELAKRAVQEFAGVAGLDADGLNAMEGAMGTAAFLKLWAAVGSKLGEAKFVDGGDANARNFAMSPDAAKARITALSGDAAWFKRWSDGDVQALAEWTRLNQIAAGVKPA